jgi:hypothetical protein
MNLATLGPSASARPVTLSARLTWKDANGAMRFTSARTSQLTDTGVIVECESAVSLPLYQLVHFQVEKAAREWVELPQPLRNGRALSAVWQVAPCKPSTGTPGGYALKFMTAAEQCDAVTARRRAS